MVWQVEWGVFFSRGRIRYLCWTLCRARLGSGEGENCREMVWLYIHTYMKHSWGHWGLWLGWGGLSDHVHVLSLSGSLVVVNLKPERKRRRNRAENNIEEIRCCCAWALNYLHVLSKRRETYIRYVGNNL